MAITASVTEGITVAPGELVTPTLLNSIAKPTVTVETDLHPLPSYAESALPTAGTRGRIVFVTDVDSGNGGLAVDDGSDWQFVFFVT